MKEAKLAKLISEAVLAGMDAANKQWQYCIFAGHDFQLKTGEQNIRSAEEGTKQIRIQQEREMLMQEHEQKMNGESKE
jgi:hypothetical protein